MKSSQTLTRRAFLRSMASVAGGAAGLSVLAACGAPAPSLSEASSTSSASQTTAPGQTNVAALRLLIPSNSGMAMAQDMKELTPDAIKQVGPGLEPMFHNLQRWKQANPTTRLEIEEVKWDTISPKFVTMMQGGDPPDLVYINDLNIRELALGDYFLPLNDYPGEWDDYNQSLLKGVATVNDQIVAMPTTTDCRCVFYWKEDFEAAGITQPPTTWDELYDVATKLNSASMAGYTFPAGPSVHTPTQSIFSSVWMQGKELQDAEDRAVFDTPEMRRVFEHLNHLMNELQVTPKSALTSSDEELQKLFVTHGAAMQHNGSWRWDAMPTESADANDKTLGYFRTPKPSADAKDSTLTGFWAYELPKTTDKARQDAAWDLASYFSGAEGQATTISYLNALPTRASVLDNTDATAQKSEFWQFAAKYAVEAGHGMPSAKQGALMFDLLRVALQKYLSGEAKLDDALAEAQTQYNDKIS